jgi:hypothetical protein
MPRAPVSVVEYSSFRTKAARLLGDEERVRLIEFVAMNPRVGKEYDGTGGVRHFRWPLPGDGKKDEVDVGYYFGDGSTEVLLVTMCKPKEVNLLSKVIRGLVGGS